MWWKILFFFFFISYICIFLIGNDFNKGLHLSFYGKKFLLTVKLLRLILILNLYSGMVRTLMLQCLKSDNNPGNSRNYFDIFRIIRVCRQCACRTK